MEEKSFIIEEVTEFSPEMADAVRKLAQQIGGNYKALTDDDFKELLSQKTHHIFVAKDTATGQVAGMVTLIVHRIPYVKKAVIEDIVVDGAYRGRGIATQLFEKVITVAKAEQAAHLDLSARPRREASNNLYEKLGFQKRETNVYRYIFDYAEV